jgi:hypothetical protein
MHGQTERGDSPAKKFSESPILNRCCFGFCQLQAGMGRSSLKAAGDFALAMPMTDFRIISRNWAERLEVEAALLIVPEASRSDTSFCT